MEFTESEYDFLINVLELAKERYTAHATTMREEPRHERVAEQFARQAEQASALIDRLNERAS